MRKWIEKLFCKICKLLTYLQPNMLLRVGDKPVIVRCEVNAEEGRNLMHLRMGRHGRLSLI